MNCTVCNKRSYSEYCVSHKPRARIAFRAAIKADREVTTAATPDPETNTKPGENALES